MTINISRPTKRSCSYLVKDNVPARLSPLFLYDSSVESSIFDENNKPATDPAFTGKVRKWNDLSGSDRHLQDRGNFVSNTRDLVYARNDNNSFPLNSSVVGSTDKQIFDIGDARRLQRGLGTAIINQSFEMFLVGGFNEAPNDYEAFFSTGALAQLGAFQLCAMDDYFAIFSRFGNTNRNEIKLKPIEVGIQNFRLTYNYEANENLKVFINGNLYADVDNYTIGFRSFRLFCNRNANVEAAATIKYLAVFGQLLSSQDAKDYSAFQQCKFAEEDGEIKQQGSLTYTNVQSLGTAKWAWVAKRIEPSPSRRKISVLSAIIKSSIFGQNFSVRVFIGGDGSKPEGQSLTGFTDAEGYSSNTNKNAQEIQFGKYDPATNMANAFLDEAVEIPPNQYAWVAITSQSAWGIGYEDVPGAYSASVSEDYPNATPPHLRGGAWDIHPGRQYAIMFNSMRML